MKKTSIFLVIFFLAFVFSMRASAAGRWQDTGDELVIVIDPGHGGIDSGSKELPPFEKDRNLATAIAFANELSKYEGVSIYLTRTTDVELTLKERAEFAHSVDADFLISLHHNGAADHSQYGSEIWIPCKSPNNAYCYQFAQIWEAEMSALGLYDRGAKVRINSYGRDYYGVIREAAYYGIPCVIIEQCYLDHLNDRAFCDEDSDIYPFARADAMAVAKYFGLSSDLLGVDYINYDLVNVDAEQIYGEVHNDPNAKESTPPGPLAEGQENPEFNDLRKKVEEDPELLNDPGTIEIPKLELDAHSGEEQPAPENESGLTGESVSEDEIHANAADEDSDAMMERLRKDAGIKEAAVEEKDKAAEADMPAEPANKLLFPAVVFAVLLLAVMLILAFARDK